MCRLLLALGAGVGFCAYLIPFYGAVLTHPAPGVSDRGRATPLARSLQADHDLTAARGAAPRLAVLAAAAEPPRLQQPGPVEGGRLADAASPARPPTAHHRPDLSRSPPGR